MDFHESTDQCIEHIGKAKAAYHLCNYDETLTMLAAVYPIVRSLIEQVYKLADESSRAERPAGEDTG